MIRLVGTLALALGIAVAQADVVDLLKEGLAARSRGDFDRAIYYYTQATPPANSSSTSPRS
jgi:hypothetical protein